MLEKINKMPATRLENIPEDVYTAILKKQFEFKKARKIKQYSKEQVVYAIIREYTQMKTDSLISSALSTRP